METRHYWEENGHAIKYENYNSNEDLRRPAGDSHNFAIPSEDEAEYMPGSYLKKGKVSRQDPMSHRIIEKRRRDRMNNCLAELSRLIPPEYLKKGRGRVEKTEIIEMTIRHLKFLQERANAAERTIGEDHFRAGFREAITESVRFLVEIQGYLPGDALCLQLASHLQRHCDHIIKGDTVVEKPMRSNHGSSSETASSSSSSHSFAVKTGVIATARANPPPMEQVFTTAEPYDAERPPLEQPYPMECDRVPVAAPIPMTTEADPAALLEPADLPTDTRRKRDTNLRTVRKPDHDDYLHSYKFKNSIERRFSRSQDCEAADMTVRSSHTHGKGYGHKRRRAAKPAPSTSTSASGSTEDTRDTSPQDTSSESPHNHHYEKPIAPTQYVPIFALNALGKYYVPLSVDYACLARHLGPYDMLDARAAHLATPLHPVTIHVNFQPCLNYVKREPAEREWRAVSNEEYHFKLPTAVKTTTVHCGHI